MSVLKHLKAKTRYNLISTFDDDAYDVIASIIAWGIKQNLQCLYYVDKKCMNELEFWLKIHCINVFDLIKTNNLIIKSAYELFVDKNLDETFDELVITTDASIKNGFHGTLVVMDRDCLVNIGFSEAEVYRYELKLQEYMATNPLTAVSCYNIDKFGISALMELTSLTSEFIYKRESETFFYCSNSSKKNGQTQNLVYNILKLREKLIKENKIYSFIAKLSSELSFKRDELDILETALTNICQSTYSSFGAAVLNVNNDGKEQIVRYNLPDKFLEVYNHHKASGFFNHNPNIVNSNCMIFRPEDINKYGKYFGDTFNKFSIQNCIMIPLKYQKEILGYLWIASQYKYTNYKENSELLIKACETLGKIIIDYGEHRKIVQSLIRSSKLNALGELTGGIAHEFNNILMPIIGYTEILKNEINDHQLLNYIDMIQSSALDGEKIVKRIQEFTVAKKKDKEIIEIDDIISKSVEIAKPKWVLESKLNNKNIDIICKLESKGMIEGIATEIREVFINLISNSLDAMPLGGEIYIETAIQDDLVIILYKDNGSGMPSEVMERIFEPFFTTKNERGNGLGLAIVYNIVKNMNGNIEVVSEEEHGTEFKISFPVIKSEIVKNTKVEKSYSNKCYKVLVLDDQPAVAQTVSEMLKVLGHDAIYITDEIEAMKLYNEYSFDCVFCDLALKNISGIEVSKMLKKENENVPIILMTGWTGKFKAEDLKNVDRILNKPFSLSELSNILNDTMNSKKEA